MYKLNKFIMEKPKKIPSFWSYLWFAFVLNLLVSLLAGLATVAFTIILFGITWILGLNGYFSSFFSFIEGNISGLEEVLTAILVILGLITAFGIAISYFVARKEFEGIYKNFSKKYENFELNKALKFATAFTVILSILNFAEGEMKAPSSDIYELAIVLVFMIIALSVLFFGYKAGADRIKGAK